MFIVLYCPATGQCVNEDSYSSKYHITSITQVKIGRCFIPGKYYIILNYIILKTVHIFNDFNIVYIINTGCKINIDNDLNLDTQYFSIVKNNEPVNINCKFRYNNRNEMIKLFGYTI